MTERQSDESISPLEEAAVREFLAKAERGKAFVQSVSERTQQVMQEADQSLLFETRDRQQDGARVHRSYLTK